MASTSHIHPGLSVVNRGEQTSETPEVQNGKIWDDYGSLASPFDQRLIEDWAKIVDVILVYIALFISVLTAFIIETTRTFQPNPGDVTNQILIAIYNQTMNGSHPIDLERYLRLDGNAHNNAVYRNGVLYASLSFAIIVAALATMARIWIIRYNRAVKAPGPGSSHLHAMRRQEIYGGVQSWWMGEFIESLPAMSLVVEVLFGLFILSSISENDPHIGFAVGNIFQLGLCYFSVTSLSGAFISNSPFRSSLSDFIRIIFHETPTHRFKLQPLGMGIRMRTVAIILAAALVLGIIAYRAVQYHPDYMGLIYFPTAAVFALMGKGQEVDIPKRRYSLPLSIFCAVSIIFIVYAISMYNITHPHIFFSCFALASLFLVTFGWIVIKMSEIKPATTAVEAVAWMLKTSSSPNPAWFQIAVEIVGNSRNSRALLLEHLLPLADPLIIQDHAPGDEVQGATPLQEEYLRCLKHLTNFHPSNGNFWRNEAPTPSKGLRNKLVELSNVECPQMTDCRHRVEGCPRCRIKLMAGDALKRFEMSVDDMQQSWIYRILVYYLYEAQ